MHRDDVMTPHHPRWNEFIEDLSKSLICARTTENARRVLESMSGIDAPRSLEELCLLGGRCDCEIVFEVGRLTERAHA